MKRVTTAEEWREVYRRGHVVFLMKYIKIFLRDYLVLSVVMLILIKSGMIKAYGTSVMIGEGLCFVLLGAVFGEVRWFLLKKRFGVPDEL